MRLHRCAAAGGRLLRLLMCFDQVAIYGYTFKEAAKQCWHLLLDVGLMPLLNNFLVQAVGWLGALVGGALCAMGALAHRVTSVSLTAVMV